MKNELRELKKQIESQNRLKVFEGLKGNKYLYDAFSQNLFPVSNECAEYFFNTDSLLENENSSDTIMQFCNKLFQWKGEQNYARTPETHLTINLSNKCNLNCSYCYRHKDNKNVMSLDKAFEVLEYADKYYKGNNDEIIFSIDMTAESFLDSDKIIAFDDKLSEYENLYIDDSDIVKGNKEDFFEILKKDLYTNSNYCFIDDINEDLISVMLDNKLWSRFTDRNTVNEILQKRNYNPEFLDKKRLLRLNRELLEHFYPDLLKHKDYQQFRIWFMSNGAHISEKDIELIKKIRIDPFWISLDGPQEIQNKNRKYYDGRGSFDDVLKNIKLLQDNNINVKISCVLTSDYPKPDALYEYFKSLNVYEVQMCPVRNGNDNSFNEENIQDLIEGYRSLFNNIFVEVCNGDFTAFRLLRDDLTTLAITNLFLRIRQSDRCTWGSEVVLDEKGDMYPCLYVIGQKEFCLGNIDEKKHSSEILKPLLVDQINHCSSCWARYLCGGTCHYNSLVSKGSIFIADDIECQIRKFIISESIQLLIKLIENHIDINQIAKVLLGK